METATSYNPTHSKWVALLILLLASLIFNACTPPYFIRLSDFEMSEKGHLRVRDWRGNVAQYTWSPSNWKTVSKQQLERDKSIGKPFLSAEKQCLPSDPTHCYRMTSLISLEETLDNGTNWQTIWQWPRQRIEFVNHGGGWHSIPEPYGFTLLEQNNTHRLFIAFGSLGIIEIDAQKHVHEYNVLETHYSPWHFGWSEFEQIFNKYDFRFFLIGLSTAILFVFYSLWLFKKPRHFYYNPKTFSLLAGASIFYILFLARSYLGNVHRTDWISAAIFASILLLAGYLCVMFFLAFIAPLSSKSKRGDSNHHLVFIDWITYYLCMFLLTSLPLYLYAIGIIKTFDTTIPTLLITGFIMAAYGYNRAQKNRPFILLGAWSPDQEQTTLQESA